MGPWSRGKSKEGRGSRKTKDKRVMVQDGEQEPLFLKKKIKKWGKDTLINANYKMVVSVPFTVS